MNWTSSDTLGLATQNCTFCFGRGLRAGKRGSAGACQCVLRHIFRVCYARFCLCLDKEKHVSSVSLTRVPGATRGMSFARKDEEFLADFMLIARHNLDVEETRIFKAHLLLGADWKLCCRQFNLDRGDFFHFVYRIMHKLGRAFADTVPYALFPLEDYYDSYCGVDLPAMADSMHELRRRRERERESRPLVPRLRTAA